MNNLKISQNGIDELIHSEGIRYQAYKDSVGFWTIGVGHLINLETEKHLLTATLTKNQVMTMFRLDISRFEDCVNKLVKVPLNQNQFDALVSFSFNLGCNALRRSTLLEKLNNGDFLGASNEFKKWNKAGGRAIKGLTLRREREKQLFIKNSNPLELIHAVYNFAKKHNDIKAVSELILKLNKFSNHVEVQKLFKRYR